MKDRSLPKYLVNVDPTVSTWFTPSDGKAALEILGCIGAGISIKPVSGTVNGQFKIQVTDFGSGPNDMPVSADWVDYANPQPASAGAITATIKWELTDLRARWLRVVFTDNSSSSPVVSVAITIRALQADS